MNNLFKYELLCYEHLKGYKCMKIKGKDRASLEWSKIESRLIEMDVPLQFFIGIYYWSNKKWTEYFLDLFLQIKRKNIFKILFKN
jgi:hypothetical protein